MLIYTYTCVFNNISFSDSYAWFYAVFFLNSTHNFIFLITKLTPRWCGLTLGPQSIITALRFEHFPVQTVLSIIIHVEVLFMNTNFNIYDRTNSLSLINVHINARSGKEILHSSSGCSKV